MRLVDADVCRLLVSCRAAARVVVRGVNTFWPSGSRDSPCMATQPRLVPPALAEWIAYSALWSCGLLKNSRDLGWLVGWRTVWVVLGDLRV